MNRNEKIKDRGWMRLVVKRAQQAELRVQRFGNRHDEVLRKRIIRLPIGVLERTFTIIKPSNG